MAVLPLRVISSLPFNRNQAGDPSMFARMKRQQKTGKRLRVLVLCIYAEDICHCQHKEKLRGDFYPFSMS